MYPRIITPYLDPIARLIATEPNLSFRDGVKQRMASLRKELDVLGQLFAVELNGDGHKPEKDTSPAKLAAVAKALKARWAGHKQGVGKKTQVALILGVLRKAGTPLPAQDVRRLLGSKGKSVPGTLSRLAKLGTLRRLPGSHERDSRYEIADAADAQALLARGSRGSKTNRVIKVLLAHPTTPLLPSDVAAASGIDEGVSGILARLVAQGRAVRHEGMMGHSSSYTLKPTS